MRKTMLIAVAVTLGPAPLYAQAWLPGAGQGAVSVIFQDMAVRQHLLSDGQPLSVGNVDSHNVMLDVSYGVTEKLALGFSLPYVSARYTGPRPHPGSLLDDGAFHGTLQDFRANVRYSLVTGGVAVTPFVDLIAPSHDYSFYGHAAPGRRLSEAQLGISVGHVLSGRLAGTFVQARYAYGFSQRSLGVYHDRSVLDGEIGHFINPRLRVLGLISGQYTHGGLPLTANFPGDLCGAANPVPPATLLRCPNFLHHDQLARSDLLDLGAGAQFALTRRLDVFGSFTRTTVGRSIHSLNHGISIGLTWGLGKSGPPDPWLGDSTKQALPKCLCQKGSVS